MPWNDNLENPSLNIAETNASPLRICAGPGTGKTFTLIRQIAGLLKDGVKPQNILFCTFTRTAADDLKNELNDFDSDDASLVCASTVHALCFRILTQNAWFERTDRVSRPLLEYEKRFLREDLQMLCKNPETKQSESIDDIDKRLKAFEAAWARLQSEEPGWPHNPTDQKFHQQLLGWLRFHKTMLIGELVPEILCYLRQNPGSPESKTFSHILVDEYQDLNAAEQKFIELISGSAQLTIVGDEDQSIYEFKYAHPEGITSFHERHPNTMDEALDLCRRCPTRTVDMANQLISNNRHRLSRTLTRCTKKGPGEVHIVQWQNMAKEAEGLSEFIHQRVHARKVAPAQILVLAPRHELGHGIRDLLRAKGVPACSFFQEEALKGSPTNLKSRKVKVQIAFTLLSLVANPEDRVALRCWCGFGGSDLRRGAWQRVRELVTQPNVPLADVLRDIKNGPHDNRYNQSLIAKLHELRDELNNLATLRNDPSALLDALFPDNDPDFSEIRAMATGFDTNADAVHLHDFLRTNITQPELPLDGDSVRIMSLHKSKGLTADLVVVMGCIEQLIPAPPRGNNPSDEELEKKLEEQRRLFYVSITRARKTLILSGVKYLSIIDARPMGVEVLEHWQYVKTTMSRFIRELGPAQPPLVHGDQFLSEELRNLA